MSDEKEPGQRAYEGFGSRHGWPMQPFQTWDKDHRADWAAAEAAIEAPLLAALAVERERVRLRGNMLEQCAVWFDEYGRSHASKGDDGKAGRNFDRAAFARAAIRATEPT